MEYDFNATTGVRTLKDIHDGATQLALDVQRMTDNQTRRDIVAAADRNPDAPMQMGGVHMGLGTSGMVYLLETGSSMYIECYAYKATANYGQAPLSPLPIILEQLECKFWLVAAPLSMCCQ